jgi:hypothetical protein
MKLATITAATALAMALGAGGVLAKAHDQGVADGTQAGPGPGSGVLIQSLGGKGISAGVNKGTRGDGASAAGSDNATDPVVGNGANAG